MTTSQQLNPDQIRAEAEALREQDEGYSLELHKQILKAWEVLRPKMWERLTSEGIAEDLALIVQMRMWHAMDQYMKAGMPPTDAREQAERECLMMEPEQEHE